MNQEKSKLKLEGRIVAIEDITDEQIDKMFEIYFKYYENITEDIFIDHLSHKDHVIILNDYKTKIIKGFSTQKLIQTKYLDKTINAIFSGDTIIEKEYQGQLELVKQFALYSGEIKSKIKTDELFWFLISKGYKTYTFLPMFFQKYYPNYQEEIPIKEKEILNQLATTLFSNEYDSKTGLISFENSMGNLRKGVGEVTNDRLDYPEIEFFNKINPNHMLGVELACIAVLCEDNLKGIAKRYFNEGHGGN
ncbi:MAG: hypothetical protein HQK51_10370 [Oligoflexia bacterium]|nr:hypothetical protein [Oligoflexia bacterium]